MRLQEEGLLRNIKGISGESYKVDYEGCPTSVQRAFLKNFGFEFLQRKVYMDRKERAYKEFASQEWVYEYGVFQRIKRKQITENAGMTGRKNREPGLRNQTQKLPEEVETDGTVSDFPSVYFYYTSVDEGEEGCKKRCRNPDHGRCSFLGGRDSVDVWGWKR